MLCSGIALVIVSSIQGSTSSRFLPQLSSLLLLLLQIRSQPHLGCCWAAAVAAAQLLHPKFYASLISRPRKHWLFLERARYIERETTYSDQGCSDPPVAREFRPFRAKLPGTLASLRGGISGRSAWKGMKNGQKRKTSEQTSGHARKFPKSLEEP
jgi:hypothetical protein